MKWHTNGNAYSYSSLRPVASIKVSITDGLGDMMGLYFRGTFKVGNGAGYLEYAAIGSG